MFVRNTIAIIAAVCIVIAFSAVSFGQTPPATLVLDGTTLAKDRETLSHGKNAEVAASFKKLTAAADKIVKANKVYSVMDKEQTPPSDDKHDYMSQAPYWWPDPAKKDGLPYIRRDGERNPELNKITDTAEMDHVIDDSETLALAYYFSGDEKYAMRSARVIRTWFLDPKTRQNANLNYGQGVPGINKGRGIGLIETRELYRVIDAAILLKGSKSWTTSDEAALRKWFGDYVKWMIESPVGQDEADEKNNHGTYYDVQVISYALFSGQTDLARKQIEMTKHRIDSQIEPDGSQPLELARTLSWGYTNMNLAGFMTIARLAENVNVDLWNYESRDGRSIKKAIAWLAPFAANEKEWDRKQIKPRKFDQTIKIFRTAAKKYNRPEYERIAADLDSDKAKKN